MTTRAALGHEVFNAVVQPRGGRLIVVGEDYWNQDSRATYPGYNGYTLGGTEWKADSDAALGAMVKWLTGKSTGADILICKPLEDLAGARWGPEFRQGLTDLGHTWTRTGSAAGFGAYEPLDYDLLIASRALDSTSYHGLTTSKEKFDYILSNAGHVLSEDGLSPTASEWARYGFYASGWHASHRAFGPPPPLGAPQWRWQRPFYMPGDGTLYRIVEYYSYEMDASVNEKGGTSTIVSCDLDSGGVLGLWSNP